MKTILEALKDLYVALGGSSSDVSGLSLNPDVIEKMATLVTSGALKELPALTGNAGKVLKVSEGATGVEWGSELPSVSADDNGDVLTVVEGVWSKAALSGGVVTYTATWDDSNIGSGEIFAYIETYGVPEKPFIINFPAYTLPDGKDWGSLTSDLYGSGCVVIVNLINSEGTAYIPAYDNSGEFMLAGYSYTDFPGEYEGYTIPVYISGNTGPDIST